MIRDLLEIYDEGGITGYQVMIDCLYMLDPSRPDLVLAKLPGEILEEILHYAQRYRPHIQESGSQVLPSEIQVRSAERWIREHAKYPVRPTNDAAPM